MRAAFINPATGWTWPWPVNYREVQRDSRSRRITELQPAAAPYKPATPIRQQGTATPRVRRLAGRLFDEESDAWFRAWERLSNAQTVYFRDFDGTTYEVKVNSYEARRVGVVRSARGGGRYVWDFTLELDVFDTVI